ASGGDSVEGTILLLKLSSRRGADPTRGRISRSRAGKQKAAAVQVGNGRRQRRSRMEARLAGSRPVAPAGACPDAPRPWRPPRTQSQALGEGGRGGGG